MKSERRVLAHWKPQLWLPECLRTESNRLRNRSVISVILYQLESYRPSSVKLFPKPDSATNSEMDWRTISNVTREPGEAKIKHPPRCPSCVQKLTGTRRQPLNLHTNRSTSAPCVRTNHHDELGLDRSTRNGPSANQHRHHCLRMNTKISRPIIVPRETLRQPTNVDTSVFTHEELRLLRATRTGRNQPGKFRHPPKSRTIPSCGGGDRVYGNVFLWGHCDVVRPSVTFVDWGLRYQQTVTRTHRDACQPPRSVLEQDSLDRCGIQRIAMRVTLHRTSHYRRRAEEREDRRQRARRHADTSKKTEKAPCTSKTQAQK